MLSTRVLFLHRYNVQRVVGSEFVLYVMIETLVLYIPDYNQVQNQIAYCVLYYVINLANSKNIVLYFLTRACQHCY